MKNIYENIHLFKMSAVFILCLFCYNVKAQIITTVAGNGIAGYNGDGGLATNAKLGSPISVICDSYGNLFIANEGSNRIRKVDTTGVITTIAGNGNYGYSGDGGPAWRAEIAMGNIFYDAGSNELLLMDSQNDLIRKQKFNTNHRPRAVGDTTIFYYCPSRLINNTMYVILLQ